MSSIKGRPLFLYRGVAQLVEYRSPKPRVAGSSPSTPATFKIVTLVSGIAIYMFKYFNQIKQEFYRITWPNRRKTISATIMVFIMIFIMAIYFFFVDWGLSSIVNLLLNLG